MIVAVFANEDSPLIGLRNLVMPLRASNIPYTSLIQVVLVGNINYLKRMYLKWSISKLYSYKIYNYTSTMNIILNFEHFVFRRMASLEKFAKSKLFKWRSIEQSGFACSQN